MGVLIPLVASASGLFGRIGALFSNTPGQNSTVNSQTIALLQSTESPGGNTTNGGIGIVGGTSLSVEGTDFSATSTVSNDRISLYVVHQGDTLSEIANMFNVSVNTIVWANNITNGKVVPGQELVILPINGVQYTVKSGDTLKSVAKKFSGDADEIAQFNSISADAKLSIGDTLIIPDGEMSGSITSSGKTSTGDTSSNTSHVTITAPSGVDSKNYSPEVGTKGSGTPIIIGYYERPILGGVKTQGIHGHNAVDLASSYGTNIMAAADGTVIVAKEGGWNGGYGSYVVISHANGTQTLYGHMSEVEVTVGQQVSQGQSIGKMGSTGDSTGNHVHFEIRGATNPF